LTGAAVDVPEDGAVAADEAALVPGAAVADGLPAGAKLTVESGTTTASLESVAWPPQPRTETIKEDPRHSPRIAGVRTHLVIIAILLLCKLNCLLSGKYKGRTWSRPSPALADPERASN
jgi:hypothetical protein